MVQAPTGGKLVSMAKGCCNKWNQTNNSTHRFQTIWINRLRPSGTKKSHESIFFGFYLGPGFSSYLEYKIESIAWTWIKTCEIRNVNPFTNRILTSEIFSPSPNNVRFFQQTLLPIWKQGAPSSPSPQLKSPCRPVANFVWEFQIENVKRRCKKTIENTSNSGLVEMLSWFDVLWKAWANEVTKSEQTDA